MTEHVLIERDGHVLNVTLNRPEKKNAMTDGMYGALTGALREAEEDRDIRAVLLSGAGDSFTSGNDLSSFASLMSMDKEMAEEPPVMGLIEALLRSTVPLVAAVEGWCVGIGATMMLHTDFIYAGRSARFHMPFTQLGAVPEAGASRLLTRRLGRQRAAEFMILSEPVGAEKAERMGFITEVTSDGEALDVAGATAKRIATLPPESVRESKALMQEDLETLLPHTKHELQRFAERLRSAEMQQVIAERMKR